MISVEAVGPFPSSANLTKEHPLARSARVDRVHEVITTALDAQPVRPRELDDTLDTGRMVLVVRLWRISPNTLDDDNLASAMKGARDAVAKWLGIDDRETDRLRFFCYQARGPTVVIQPTGRQRKVRRWQTVRVEIRQAYVNPAHRLPAESDTIDSLRGMAEMASLHLEYAERTRSAR